MAQTKFDKQVDESADTLARGIARMLAGRDLDGVRRTDATFWRAGTRVLPKVEGKVRRRSYKPGWRRLFFRLALGGGAAESGYLTTRDLDATRETLRELTELWENREAALAALEPAGIGAASVLTVGTATHMVLTRERRELMREWVGPLHDALHQALGLAEQTHPRRYLHIPKNFTDDDAQIRIDLPTRLGFSRDVVADLAGINHAKQPCPSPRKNTDHVLDDRHIHHRRTRPPPPSPHPLLFEVTPELYVGTVSSKVRDELWAIVTACTNDGWPSWPTLRTTNKASNYAQQAPAAANPSTSTASPSSPSTEKVEKWQTPSNSPGREGCSPRERR